MVKRPKKFVIVDDSSPAVAQAKSREQRVPIFKLDVTWSYVKRQTARMTSEFVFFSSNPSLNQIKIKMSPNIRHKYKYFHSTVRRAKDRRQKFHFCRLPFDVGPRNVKLNLSYINLSNNNSDGATSNYTQLRR